MPGCARKEIIDESEVGVYHCFSRCVRRAFLCGVDEYTGRNYDHRKDWIDERLEELAGIYYIDVLGFAVLDNHFHSKLRNRPDLAGQASNRAIARRALLLYPKKDRSGKTLAPTEQEIKQLTSDHVKLEKWRERLSSISWFMKSLKEPIARRANTEDGVDGVFWQGRFKSVRLLDESAVLACSLYVDLNPIRAGVADRPENSAHTSIELRLKTLKDSERKPRRGKKVRGKAKKRLNALLQEDPRGIEPAPHWLSPINELSGTLPELGRMTPRQLASAEDRARASDDGFLSMTLTQYAELVDWAGRQVRADKVGAIPENLAPILERLGLSPEVLIDQARHFGKYHRKFAGAARKVRSQLKKVGRKRMHGISHCRKLGAE